jgi:hypothetical protein
VSTLYGRGGGGVKQKARIGRVACGPDGKERSCADSSVCGGSPSDLQRYMESRASSSISCRVRSLAVGDFATCDDDRSGVNGRRHVPHEIGTEGMGLCARNGKLVRWRAATCRI